MKMILVSETHYRELRITAQQIREHAYSMFQSSEELDKIQRQRIEDLDAAIAVKDDLIKVQKEMIVKQDELIEELKNRLMELGLEVTVWRRNSFLY